MDSDDEHDEREPTEPEWRRFEKGIQKLLAGLDPSAEVLHDQQLPGRLSGTSRQVDVLVQGSIAGEKLTIAVECKRYTKPLGIGAVDEFVGKLLDVGVDRGVLYALTGLTGPASARAHGASQPKVSVGDLVEGDAHVEPDFRAVLSPKFGDCPNENCYTGDVRWSDWTTSTGEILRAGACDACGAWAAVCPECHDHVDFVWDETQCWCGTELALTYDHEHVAVEALDVTTDEGEARYFATFY